MHQVKRLLSFLLVVALLLSMTPAVFAADEPQQPAKIIIDQIYGGGGKGETPISNSFIQLYNPNSSAVDLTGYTLVYGDKSLDLSGTIPGEGSYLVVGAGEVTDGTLLTYELPQADQTCDWVINNKTYTISLTNNGVEVDSITAKGSGNTKISKQKSLARNGHADTDSDDDFRLVVWEKESVTVDEAYVIANAPRNSQGDMGSVYGSVSEPTYTPVVADDNRVTGFYDATGSLKLQLAGRHNSGAMNADGGSLEIVQYNASNGFAYAVSGVKGKLIAVDLNGSLAGDTVVSLPGTEYDIKSMISVGGFTYGDMTSVAISPEGDRLAVAIQAENYAAQGIAALFACAADGSLELLSTVPVGVQPDMITFADSHTILTADEGEPRNGASAEDPKGSVSIITIGDDDTLSADTVTFDSFDSQRDELVKDNVLIQKGSNPSTDFEPEYIAVSGGTAYVSLQEANAIAVLDIENKAFTAVYPLGFQDYSQVPVDLRKNDEIALETFTTVSGIKMPDGIAAVELNGTTYLLTANEGDSRSDWDGLDNEVESKTSPTGDVTLDSKVVWFNTEMWDGLDSDKAYVFGGRSFSIYQVAEDGLSLVFDSGSDFEEITAQQLPDYFNASNDKISLDNRSGKKGPEPETVTVGTVDGKTYAFVALERIGGVMVYDITDPADAEFVNYINSREFENVIQGDVSPEGLCFISADDSKSETPLVLAACEVSGTLAVYELTPVTQTTPGGGSSGSSGSGSSSGTTTPETPETPAQDASVSKFTDVAPNAYYRDAVAWAVSQGITSGTSQTTFSPDAPCTRAQAITFLWKAAGSPAPKNHTTAFTDVPQNSYYADAVQWAVEQGITSGTSATTFGSNDVCTRAQIIAFLWALEQKTGSGKVDSDAAAPVFTDVAPSSYYADAVNWAVAQGITSGTGADTFSPNAVCTRAQIVTFLYHSIVQ